MAADIWSLIPKNDKWKKNLNELGWKDLRITGTKLGSGSCGDVLEVIATRAKDNKEVVMACKILRPKKSSDKSYSDIMKDCVCMLNDVKRLTEIRHDNIVQTFGALHVADRRNRFPFSMILLLMEKSDTDLFDLMQKRILTEELQKFWFRQIAEAVRYLHNQISTAHLDIKPENILVFCPYAKRKHVLRSTFKLTDFGSAATIGKKVDHTRQMIGSLNFQAPEIAMSNPVGPSDLTKCDIYSLGMTLKDSVTNSKPNNISPEWYARQFSRHYYDIVHGMTQNTAWKRPSIDRVLKHQWLS